MAIASMNRELSGNGLETVFLPADKMHVHVSATMIREIITLGGDVSAFVPERVSEYLKQTAVFSAHLSQQLRSLHQTIVLHAQLNPYGLASMDQMSLDKSQFSSSLTL